MATPSKAARDAAEDFMKWPLLERKDPTNDLARAFDGIAAERQAAIVAWLRGGYETIGMTCSEHEANELADRIEARQHKETKA
jgi:hypothetical protein